MSEPIKIHFQTTADLQAGKDAVRVTKDVKEATEEITTTSGSTTSGGTMAITVQAREAGKALEELKVTAAATKAATDELTSGSTTSGGTMSLTVQAREAEKAVEGLTAAAKRVQPNLEAMDISLDNANAALARMAALGPGAVRPVGDLGIGAGRTAEKVRELERANRSVTASNVSMRMGLQNVGYQVQDFAVQVQSGTSATRAFSQQAPQLLSGLGPWGVALGTVVALGAPLVGMLFDSKEAAEDAGEAYDEVGKKINDMAAAKSGANMEAWLDSLNAEEEAIGRVNAQLEANARLVKARNDAQAKIDAAERDLAKAQIDADPNLTEEEKIRKKAGIDEEAQRSAAQRELDGLKKGVEDADRLAGDKESAAKGIEQDLEYAKQERARLEEQKRAADAELRKSTNAEKSLPGAKEAVKQAQKNLNWGDPFGEGFEANKRALEEAERVQMEIENEVARKRPRERKSAGLTAEMGKLDEGIKQREEELRRAEEEAEQARREANTRAGEAPEIARGVVGAYEAGKKRRELGTNQSIRGARQKADEEARRKEFDELQSQRDAARSGSDEMAREGSSRFGAAAGRVDGDLKRTMEGISKGLSNGTNSGEIEAMMRKLEQSTEGMGGTILSGLKKLLEKQLQQERKIAQLEGQIKNARNGK